MPNDVTLKLLQTFTLLPFSNRIKSKVPQGCKAQHDLGPTNISDFSSHNAAGATPLRIAVPSVLNALPMAFACFIVFFPVSPFL